MTLPMAESVHRRVLIVDDEAAIVEVLSEHLDLNMPSMNGVEVLRSLKQIDASIEVVMVSGTAETRLTADAQLFAIALQRVRARPRRPGAQS